MPEPKRFMMVPNAEHSLATGILEAVPGIGAFLQTLLNKDVLPEFTWAISETTGDITVTLNEVGTVFSATMWYASSCGENAWDNNTKRRDYRVAHMDAPCTCGPVSEGMCVNQKALWSKKTLQPTMVQGKRTYTAHVDTPTDGTWTAFFIDIKYRHLHADEQQQGQQAPQRAINVQEMAKSIKRDPRKRAQTPLDRIKQQYAVPAAADVTTERQYGGLPHDFGGFLEFTSEVSVWPNTFPYADCSGESCGVRIV